MFPPIAADLTRERIAGVLLVLLAFSAWSLTGLAHVCLFLLLALFLADLHRHWPQLSPDPGLWLLIGIPSLTALLAWRASRLLPETAVAQWGEIWDWSAPILFVIVAWWVRGDRRLIRAMLIAACLGVLLGVIRKADWSQLEAALQGVRYEPAQSALGLGFITSVIVLGLLLFQGQVLSLHVAGVRRPVIGWGLWILALATFLGIFVATQSRGTTLGLIAVTLSYSLYRGWRKMRRRGVARRDIAGIAAGIGLALVLGALMLWATADRFAVDFEQVAQSSSVDELSYRSSAGIRIHLYRIGLQLFAEKPLLGWGPGTSGTEYLVPAKVIPLSAYHQENAPSFSHLHSVPIEILVRFGLAGIFMALWLLAVLAYGYRALWRSIPETGDPLRAFLVLGGILTLLYGLHDFRYVNTDIRFFLILFPGLIYSFVFRLPANGSRDGSR